MKKLVCFLILATAIAGCQKNRNNDPIRNAEEASKDRELQKTFTSECSIKPLDAIVTGLMTAGKSSVKSGQVSYRFDGVNVVRQTRLYTSADCSGDVAVTFEEAGTIKIDKESRGRNNNDNAREIEMDFDSLTAVVLTKENAEAANTARLCGLSNWEANKERDVTAQSEDVLCYNAKVPRHVSNIYRVDDGVLYLGTVTKGSVSKEERPTSLSSTKYTSK